MILTLSTHKVIDLALEEDLAYGDITTDNLFQATDMGEGTIVSRQSAVISGLEVASTVFQKLDPAIRCTWLVQDGDTVTPNTALMRLEGSVGSILKGERLALNFIQHLSGVATLTYQYVGAVSGTQAKITHTRKTIPGLREMEIQAVLHGGGSPHRKSLSHAVLIKDNHIQAAGGIRQAVGKIKAAIGHTIRIEVECDTLNQVEEALDSGVDLVLLDNMNLDMLKKAVLKAKNRAQTEASGGVTLSNVLEIAKTGVDYISTSQITMSASAVDIGMDF